MNSLPAGTYTFTVTDACGIVKTQQYTINGYNVLQNNFTITPHCGAFDIAMAHTATTGVFNDGYYLQEYNAITGNWGHPSTGVNYPEGTLPTTANSLQLTNNTNLLSLPYTGDFRVLKIFYTWGNGTTVVQRCTSVIYTFTFEGGPQITDAYSFPCAGGLNEVIVVATGISPLTYKITTKNGAPFVIDNGTSNLFSGLESATYNFQVADICGNIRNIQFDINALDPVEIEENGFCEGEDSSLTIEEFSFLTYKWYEASAPNTILSTTGTLNFPAFNSANDAGTYMLQITYSANTGSCLNQLIAYPILPNTLPNAGPDGNASLCNEGAVLDLNDYLTAPFDTAGTWAETTVSGAFSGSSFDTAGLAEGTYTFTYTVTGICALDDVATISITLKDIPPAPVVPPVAPVCEGQNVQMFAGIVNGATYQWTGPNGFTFAGATPLIAGATPAASGTYSVTMTSGNGCVSPPSTVVVTVNALPQFTLQGSTLLCDGQSTTISVVADNFTDNQVTYAWYFDNGLLTGLTTSGAQVYDTGTYEVVVTYNGCSASQQIVVAPNTDAFSFELEAGCIDENYIISVVNLTGITEGTYEWTGPMGFSYTGGPEADITNLTPGDYSVTITSAEGCFVTETLPVANTRCSIPRGISPNGDEWNNNFDLSNLEVQHLAIFNRYGMKVYEANSYVDEWHGQSTSGDLPTGAYYYVATLSAGAQRTGWVYLQREIK
ncbi:MAG: gliding motility-associated C-terminal domain-containing protein [Sphingobacteriales bacterium]|nr:MAG: gliding motility-associated C-terminal domain-containing protein [Sphingobacteriales bacterium]